MSTETDYDHEFDHDEFMEYLKTFYLEDLFYCYVQSRTGHWLDSQTLPDEIVQRVIGIGEYLDRILATRLIGKKCCRPN